MSCTSFGSRRVCCLFVACGWLHHHFRRACALVGFLGGVGVPAHFLFIKTQGCGGARIYTHLVLLTLTCCWCSSASLPRWSKEETRERARERESRRALCAVFTDEISRVVACLSPRKRCYSFPFVLVDICNSMYNSAPSHQSLPFNKVKAAEEVTCGTRL